MNTFFRGWRRKTGCLTLVMALAVMSMWIRSAYVKDVFIPPRWVGLNAALFSLEHSIAYQHFNATVTPPEPFWVSFPITGSEINAAGDRWKWRCNGFGYISNSEGYCLMAPYWCFAVPLTMLSACLILWTPRKRPTEKEAPSTR